MIGPDQLRPSDACDASIPYVCGFLVSDIGEKRGSHLETRRRRLALVCTATELFYARPAEGKSIVPRSKAPTLPNTPFFPP